MLNFVCKTTLYWKEDCQHDKKPNSSPSPCSLITFSNAWKDIILVKLSQSGAKGGNLTNCWICHQVPKSVRDQHLALVAPVIDFDTIPNGTVFQTNPHPTSPFRYTLFKNQRRLSPTCNYLLPSPSNLNLTQSFYLCFT